MLKSEAVLLGALFFRPLSMPEDQRPYGKNFFVFSICSLCFVSLLFLFSCFRSSFYCFHVSVLKRVVN